MLPSTTPISFLRANLLGSAIFAGWFFGLTGLHALVWHLNFAELLLDAGDFGWLAVALLLAGVLAHEALHGVGFMVFARAPFKQLHFGIQWCCLTPYAGCRMEMPVQAYRRACALPGIVTGLLPALFGIASGWTDLTLYGALMVGGAGGDMWILWSVRRLPAQTLVKDSENRVGCEVVQAVTA